MERTQPYMGSETGSYAGEVAQLLALVQARRRYYHDMLRLLPAAVAVVAGDGSIRFANAAFYREFGLREQALIHDAFPAGVWRQIRGGASSFFLDRSGRRLVISAACLKTTEYSEEKEIVLLIHNSRATDLNEDLNHKITTDIPAILWRADRRDLAFLWAHGALDLLGFPIDHWLHTPEFFSRRMSEDDRAETMALYRRVIERGGEASAEFRALTDAGMIWVRETIRVSGDSVVGVMIPAGDRRDLQEQRIRDQRVQVSRRLALQSAASLAPPAAELVNHEENNVAIERISQIARELSGVTSPSTNPLGVVNLGRLLKQWSGRAQLKVAVDVDAGQFVLAFAEESRLEEVLGAVAESLCRDALEGGRLTVACDLHTLTERIPGATLDPGTYARLLLHHHGRGLELELHEPLFESLTSISPKRATLPALSRAYATVREWGGDIAFLSEPNAAIFVIYLPNCPIVEWVQDPVPKTGDAIAEASYDDLVDLLLTEVSLAAPNEPETVESQGFEIDAELFE
jgi:PAS domain-containing protein